MCLQDSSTSNITDKYVNAKCKYDFTVDKRQRKVSIATKEDIVDYCKSIVNTNFYGEVEPKERQKNASKQRTRKTSLFDMGFLSNEKSRKFSEDEILIFQVKKPTLTLGILLKNLHQSIQQQTDYQSMAEDHETQQCLRYIAEQRKSTKESTKECYNQLYEQFKIFLKIKEQTKGLQIECDVKSAYWGSRQQLRAGKVIADHVTLVEIDPIFGVLLHPSAGQYENREPYLNRYQNESEFQYPTACDVSNLPISYHYVMQDAFSYLKEKHNVGPCSNYLDEYALFHSNNLSGNMLAIIFWERLLNRIIEEEIYIEIKKL